MKKIMLGTFLAIVSSIAMAQVTVSREDLGSGQPESVGNESATSWDGNIFHAPQYMPGYPTAAVLYPRVVDVQCKRTINGLQCKGYNWLPELGRGEYLMIRPILVEEPKPVVINNTTIKEVIVFKEVPAKKKSE